MSCTKDEREIERETEGVRFWFEDVYVYFESDFSWTARIMGLLVYTKVYIAQTEFEAVVSVALVAFLYDGALND